VLDTDKWLQFQVWKDPQDFANCESERHRWRRTTLRCLAPSLNLDDLAWLRESWSGSTQSAGGLVDVLTCGGNTLWRFPSTRTTAGLGPGAAEGAAGNPCRRRGGSPSDPDLRIMANVNIVAALASAPTTSHSSAGPPVRSDGREVRGMDRALEILRTDMTLVM
jgi:hypothetical protein